jgi:hypothetical protein
LYGYFDNFAWVSDLNGPGGHRIFLVEWMVNICPNLSKFILPKINGQVSNMLLQPKTHVAAEYNNVNMLLTSSTMPESQKLYYQNPN